MEAIELMENIIVDIENEVRAMLSDSEIRSKHSYESLCRDKLANKTDIFEKGIIEVLLLRKKEREERRGDK